MQSDATVPRREFLKAAGLAAAGTAFAGCAVGGQNRPGNQNQPVETTTTTAETGGSVDSGGWFDDVDNFDGVVDETGSDTVTVEVGAEGNGGTFAFAPAAVRVASGTTVRFAWSSNTHNVVVESQPDGAGWQGHEAIENEGFEFESTFGTPGQYLYVCEPHRSMGMKGAVVVE